MSMIWLEAVLGFAVPVGWGLWELHALRRDREAAARRAALDSNLPTNMPPAVPATVDNIADNIAGNNVDPKVGRPGG